MKPRLLDLFCGAGGCTKGYQRAGFYVVGVDVSPQPRYCGDEFVQADALEVLRLLCQRADDGEAVDVSEPSDDQVSDLVLSAGVAVGRLDVEVNKDLAHSVPFVEGRSASCFAGPRSQGFDAIHASPPCPSYSVANNVWKREHPRLIPEVRAALKATGLPYVIENVEGARTDMIEPYTLCGLSLGMNVKRHRLFETSFPLMVPPCHSKHDGDWLLVFGHTVMERGHVVRKTPAGHNTTHRRHTTVARGREAMGIDWMNRDELSDAIPPAYTELIGAQLLDHLRAQAAA